MGGATMSNAMIVGVGFLLFSRKNSNRVFTVEELASKPEYCKQKGMISFPLETQIATDNGTKGTIERLIKEEIGFPLEWIEIVGVSESHFSLIPDRDDIVTRYGFGFLRVAEDSSFSPSDVDIDFAGWRRLEDLLNPPTHTSVRIETRPIICDFIKNYR